MGLQAFPPPESEDRNRTGRLGTSRSRTLLSRPGTGSRHAHLLQSHTAGDVFFPTSAQFGSVGLAGILIIGAKRFASLAFYESILLLWR